MFSFHHFTSNNSTNLANYNQLGPHIRNVDVNNTVLAGFAQRTVLETLIKSLFFDTRHISFRLKTIVFAYAID